MTSGLPQKIIDQMKKAGLPSFGRYPFNPKVVKNRRGDLVIDKKSVQAGPKNGKRGYVDQQGRIWVKDRSHAGVPDHWDVQLEGGADYIRVDFNGNEIV